MTIAQQQKQIPKSAIRMVIDRLHVATPDAELVANWTRRCNEAKLAETPVELTSYNAVPFAKPSPHTTRINSSSQALASNASWNPSTRRAKIFRNTHETFTALATYLQIDEPIPGSVDSVGDSLVYAIQTNTLIFKIDSALTSYERKPEMNSYAYSFTAQSYSIK
jgi:hypothetical protein